MDEATSALDRANEAHLYGLLSEVGIHYISVGHWQSLLDDHDRVLELRGEDQWRLMPTVQYKQLLTAGG